MSISPEYLASASIEAAIAPKLSLALHHNAVPVLRELAILNNGDAPLEGIELTLGSEPAFFRPKTWRIDRVGPKQSWLGEFGQGDRWRFCLTAAGMARAQERR